MKHKNMHEKLVASMQAIALDSINKAKGGHIGMAIGAAPITAMLFTKFLNINMQDPKWINRDRFILSAGHGSMSMYSVMHFLGMLSTEDMQAHKKLQSKTPSHPEIDALDYVDATTGPLGQGVAMGVGMALSQKILASKFNKPNFELFNHDVFVLHGDGCLQEGVALEAIQFAGTNKLDKLILIHDFNNVQIDSKASEVNNINLINYFKSQNFKTFVVKIPNEKNLTKAIELAKASDKPSYIQVHTKIAKHTPYQGTPKGHNGTLDEKQTLRFKRKLGLENKMPFVYDYDVFEYTKSFWEEKEKSYQAWEELFNSYQKAHPQLARELFDLLKKEKHFDLSNLKFKQTNVATRNYVGEVLSYIDSNFEDFVVGSADLYAATKVGFSKQLDKNIKYGIREFSMAAINNGINLDAAYKTIDSTFLAFADYMKPALRLGSLMELPAIHVFSHDSYQVGGDGPTHQPFDQIPMLRAMSNFKVFRPCDESEVKHAFSYALNAKKDQVAIITCRQNLKSLNLAPKNFTPAYVAQSVIGDFDLTLLATGSEVQLALEVAEELKKHSIKAQVVSVMLLDELVNNENLALSLGLNKAPMYALEASSDSYWYKLSKFNKLDGQFANGYGYSEDGDKVYKLKGFEAQSIAKNVLAFLKK